MRISVLGLGYVGAVSAACLAEDGHEVVGADTAASKVDLINAGRSPIVEKGLDDIIRKCVSAGRLEATTDTCAAVLRTDLSFICVGTPSLLNGSLDLRYVRAVCEQIGAALRQKQSRHEVVIRSTMLPGTTRQVVIPILEETSGKRAGRDFGVCINPEFLREGTAVHDYYNPPKTVIGQIDVTSEDVLAEIYGRLTAPIVRTRVEVAEMVKYTDNVWHALKVGFANEVGSLCRELGIDSHKVMEIFCQDIKLNLSAYYLRPGFAFGGSCLPKDLRALTYKARSLDLDLPILNAILPSNERMLERTMGLIRAEGKRKVLVLGISFKAGTDDLRESPQVDLVERLLGKGYEVRIYDRSVRLASLVGANRDYVLNHIPHVSKLLLSTLEDGLAFAEVIVIGNADAEFRDILGRVTQGQVVVDLVRVRDELPNDDRYRGICW
jgi:GDP-mannose 6-dehydrogenase